jgi:hypothetical protein
MSDSDVTLEVGQFVLGKRLGDQAHGGVEADFLSIGGGDTGAFLSTMLESVKAEESNSGNIYSGSIDAEYTAAFMHS